MRIRPALTLLLVLLMAAGLAAARVGAPPTGEDASRGARAAAERGEIVALETLLADALRRHPGTVLEVELDDGEYEIEILRKDGRVAELNYEARTGRLVEVEIEDAEEEEEEEEEEED